MQVDFLILGAQKSGTSALDFYLRKHPDIGMAQTKEVHFFDNEDFFQKPDVNYSEYHNHFDFTAVKKVYGEATPIYLYWDPCSKRIWKYNKNIKLIILLRNPIDRAFSHWNMEFDRNADTDTFFNCIRNEKDRLKEALTTQHRVYSYVDRGLYSQQIIRYKKYFPDDQLLFIKYENFITNQNSTLKKVFDFLKIDSDKYTLEEEIIHKITYHHEMTNEERSYLKTVFKNEIVKVEVLLNWDCRDWRH